MDDEHSDQEEESIFAARDRDWLLSLLVNLANKKLEAGITLQISGLLVSGQLASEASYLEWISSELTETAAHIFEGTDTKFGEIVPNADELYGSEERSMYKAVPTFLHLRNAKFYVPGSQQLLPQRGVWWRGRLSEVSGFFLGELRQQA
jgi:hypothetical protein